MTVSATHVSALLYSIEQDNCTFANVIEFIDTHYHYIQVPFRNGVLSNALGVNEGSAKVFGFAKLHGLNQLDTLKLFCEHYKAVQATPLGQDHANIRNFLHYGWQGFYMSVNALKPR